MQDSTYLADSSLTTSNIPQLEYTELIPENEIAFTFDTTGWKVSATILTLTFVVTLYFLVRRYLSRSYRRAAIELINKSQIEFKSGNTAALNDCFVILKQVAITTYGRSQVAPLSGKDWFTFLDTKSSSNYWTENEIKISNFIYQNQLLEPEVANNIFKEAKKWINVHPTT